MEVIGKWLTIIGLILFINGLLILMFAFTWD